MTLNVKGRTWVNSDGKRNMPTRRGLHRPARGERERDRSASTCRRRRRASTSRASSCSSRRGSSSARAPSAARTTCSARCRPTTGARRLGEIGIGTNFGIDRAIGATLFDEKIGGTVHLALGRSYPETGGKNESALHWDLICDLRAGGKLSRRRRGRRAGRPLRAVDLDALKVRRRSVAEGQVSAHEPVRRIPGDEELEVEDGTGVCLSGGGYRAMLFHAGSLWRLSELGILGGVKRISSVSGGSITAARLAMAWPVEPDAFEDEVVKPLRKLASTNSEASAVLLGLLGPGTIAEQAARLYRRRLLGKKTLRDLRPSRASSSTRRTSRPGRSSASRARTSATGGSGHSDADIQLATAVAASAAFPPPPLAAAPEAAGDETWGAVCTDPAFRTELMLSDGGVYDNLGLETVWKRLRTVLVSDAGGTFVPAARPAHTMLRQMPRVIDAIDAQVRDLRVRQTIESYARGDRDGAYMGIRQPIEEVEGTPVPHGRHRQARLGQDPAGEDAAADPGAADQLGLRERRRRGPRPPHEGSRPAPGVPVSEGRGGLTTRKPEGGAPSTIATQGSLRAPAPTPPTARRGPGVGPAGTRPQRRPPARRSPAYERVLERGHGADQRLGVRPRYKTEEGRTDLLAKRRCLTRGGEPLDRRVEPVLEPQERRGQRTAALDVQHPPRRDRPAQHREAVGRRERLEVLVAARRGRPLAREQRRERPLPLGQRHDGARRSRSRTSSPAIASSPTMGIASASSS